MAGLTLTVVFEGMSLNYGESLGNISELKKLTRADKLYTYLSRQALRYELYRTLKELYNIDSGKEEPLTASQGVVQFKSEANIKDYVEVDLFGYMKTTKNSGSDIRPAVVRVSPAIALEPMKLDTEFGTNLNFAQRTNSNPNPFQFEHHYTFYTYTLTVELDRVGKDGNIELEQGEKAKRVNMLLDAVKFLTRNIKGRMENLSPVFAIGGVYPIKNPFFMGRVKVGYDDTGYKLITDAIKSTLEISLKDDKKVSDYTTIGFIDGYFVNKQEIQNLKQQDSYEIDNLFKSLKSQVNQYYGV